MKGMRWRSYTGLAWLNAIIEHGHVYLLSVTLYRDIGWQHHSLELSYLLVLLCNLYLVTHAGSMRTYCM